MSGPQRQGMASRGDLLVAVLALIVAGAGWRNDFVFDDLPIIADTARLHTLANWREILTNPFWPPPFNEEFYRPVTSLLLAAQYTLGGGSPLAFRIGSAVLFVAATVGLHQLLRLLIPAGAALAAAALFAAHPVHVEAIAQGVSQAELLVGLAAIAIVTRYVQRRKGEGMRPRDWGVVAATFALAAFSKENGYVLPLLLVAAEFSVARASLRDRYLALREGYLFIGIVCVVSLIARAFATSGHPLGAFQAPALDDVGLLSRIAMMLPVPGEWFRLLAWPARLQVDYGDIPAANAFGAAHVLGALVLIAGAAAAVVARHAAPLVTFGIAWCAITLLPVSNLIPSRVWIAERTLFTPSVGWVIVAGAAGAWLMARVPRSRAALVVGTAALVVLGLGRSISRHREWNSRSLLIPGRGPALETVIPAPPATPP